MAFDILAPENVFRSAQAVRGRYGWDVWDRGLAAPEASQIAFLERHGMREELRAPVREQLFVILAA